MFATESEDEKRERLLDDFVRETVEKNARKYGLIPDSSNESLTANKLLRNNA
jgi:hypothetical protein